MYKKGNYRIISQCRTHPEPRMFKYLFALFVLAAPLVLAQEPTTTDSSGLSYPYSQELDPTGRFTLSWGYDRNNRIRIRTKVTTRGWISLGLLSPNSDLLDVWFTGYDE